MDDVTVLVTGSGGPGIKGTIFSLKNNFDNRKVVIIGTDINESAAGRFLCDGFYRIARPHQDEYLTRLLQICGREQVDVLLPQNTAELQVLADHAQEFEDAGTVVAVSGSTAIEIANDKYRLLNLARTVRVPSPDCYRVETGRDLMRYAETLGWPDDRVVVKPPVSNGMRGFRIIDEHIDRKSAFYAEKPSGVHTTMDALRTILGESFPPLLVMEYLPGREYTVDVFRADRCIALPRRREEMTSGITFRGVLDDRPDIVEASENLSAAVGLQYAHGFQFKLDAEDVPRLLESNPRIQGTMVLSTFAGANIIYSTVKHALGEPVPDFDIHWNTGIVRYWGGVGIRGDEVVGLL